MITIYKKDKTERFKVGLNEGSIRRYNLMTDDYIKLKFSLIDNEPLLIGDYVDLSEYKYEDAIFNTADDTTKLFVVDRNYYPKYNKDTGGWDYDVQINAYYKQWNNRILMFTPDNGVSSAEASFSLTDSIEVHAAMLERNLKNAGFHYKGTDIHIKIDESASNKGLKLITYSTTTMYSALNLIADTFECEWWMDGGSTLWFGYRNKGNEPIQLNLNKHIADASTNASEGVHATRLYAFGGTTNIPKHYRD